VSHGFTTRSARGGDAVGRPGVSASSTPGVLKEVREGRMVEHPVYRDDGTVETLRGRVRLCPYYFIDASGETSLGGCLATIVPGDKKKIHGMRDGVMVPCIEG